MKKLILVALMCASMPAFAVTAYLKSCTVKPNLSGTANVYVGEYQYFSTIIVRRFRMDAGYCPQSIEVD